MPSVMWSTTSSGHGFMTGPLQGMRRCPHCSIAEPRLELVWRSEGQTYRSDGGASEHWGAFQCSTCGSVILASARKAGPVLGYAAVDRTIPTEKTASTDLPASARNYLQQAYLTLSAPDAATVMAASAVDAMLKEIGYSEGSLYARIEKALEDNVLTQGMADWAHAVRFGANNVRHADGDKPHATPEEAAQAVEFAEALGSFLFVLTARIKRGIDEASKATGSVKSKPKGTP